MMPVALLVTFVAALAFGPVAEDAAQADPRTRTLVVYDVRDLVSDAAETESPNGPTIEDLSTLLRGSVLKDSRAEIKVQSSAGSLIVVATAEEHRAINEALTDLRMSEGSLYQIEIRILEVPASRLAELDGEAVRVLDGTLDSETDRLKGRANVLSAPRIVARPLQRAMLSVLNQVKFVKGYSLVEELDGIDGALTVPEIAQFDDGVVVDVLVSPIPKNRDRLARVDLRVRVGRIERPIAVEASEYGPVHKPVTTTREVETAVTAPLGKVLLLSTAGSAEGEDAATDAASVIVLLEVKLVE